MALDRLQTVDMTINMGPQHPSTHGVFRMVLRVDGERILDCEPYIGYLHRGFEKLSENENYHTVLIHLDRTDYLAGFCNEMAYIIALEKLLGVVPSERAEYIRVIMCELNRIASHMMFYGALGADAGALTPFLYAFRERERLQGLFEAVSGARMMFFYFRAGGVRIDLPDGFIRECRRVLDAVKFGIDECDKLLTNNEVFISRTKGIGAISAAAAIDYGCSGPILRACGVKEDVRRSEPYSIYDRLDFDIPVAYSGDTYDRYVVRMEEMRQSIRIVEQCLDQIPDGPFMGKVPRFIRPEPGEVYVRTENPRGDYGIYLISRGGDYPYRVKLRSPCFCNLMALREMLKDCYIADSVMVLGSLDIVLGEVDR
ncbi:MAG: NADH-quinone oxidoreductase subunit D [Dehalococcoidia bacterium]|nr:NADH-quinone oxidoreductase subunit D [Dehalococcoidia bacterium]